MVNPPETIILCLKSYFRASWKGRWSSRGCDMTMLWEGNGSLLYCWSSKTVLLPCATSSPPVYPWFLHPQDGWFKAPGLKGRMDEKRLSLCQIPDVGFNTTGKKIYILKKKMSGISLELLFLLEAEGSWRGEEGWDVYEVCGEFGRKLTEGGQMAGGAGSVTLSLSLLGRPVQARPWSGMARSHLQQEAAPWETWLVRSSSSRGGGEGQHLKTLGKRGRRAAGTGFGGTRVTLSRHHLSKPKTGIPTGCRWCCG